jgi:4-oxalocrotonate tautomerase
MVEVKDIVDAILFLEKAAFMKANPARRPMASRSLLEWSDRLGRYSSSQRTIRDKTSRRRTMPIVNIQITREGTLPGYTHVTREQKAQLIEGVSKLLLDVLMKPMNSTFVVIDEVDVENWGWGGLPVEEYRKRMAASAHVADTKLAGIAKE